MRDVLDELMAWWEAGETVGVGTVVATFRSAPRPPGASMLVGPDETAVGSVSGGCVEGAVYELAAAVVASGEPVLRALRRLRRRRLRRRPDLRRHPRRLGRAGLAARPSPSSARSPPTSRRAGRSPWPPSSSTPTRPGWASRLVVRPDGRPSAGGSWSDRATDAVADDALGLLASGHQRDPDLRPRRRAPRRGHAGLRVGASRPSRGCWSSARSTSPPPWPGSARSSATTSPSATPARSSPPPAASPTPTGSSSTGRTATCTAEQEAGAIDERTVITVLTHDPKFDVPAARGGAAPARGRLRRRDGLAAHPRRPDGAAARGRPRPTPSSTGSPARSGSTSAPAPRRRPRSASPRSSSPAAGAASGERLAAHRGPRSTA